MNPIDTLAAPLLRGGEQATTRSRLRKKGGDLFAQGRSQPLPPARRCWLVALKALIDNDIVKYSTLKSGQKKCVTH